MRRFSKLKKQIESLFEPTLNMEFCCSAYPMRTKGYASNSIPRFYVKLGEEIIWDYPKDFQVKDIDYGYWAGNNGISELVREYIDTPVEELLTKEFEGECREYGEIEINYNLTDIFKAADRRIGRNKLIEWIKDNDNDGALKILIRRAPYHNRTLYENSVFGTKLFEKQTPTTYKQAREQFLRLHGLPIPSENSIKTEKPESQSKMTSLKSLMENNRLGMEQLSKQQPTTFEKAKEQAEKVRTQTLSNSKKNNTKKNQ